MLARERTAWVWLTALVVVFGAYFSAVSLSPERASFLARIGMLSAAVTTLALIVGVDHLIGYLQGRSASPIDERDRLIQLRASATAYYVLMAGMIVVGCVMPFGADRWEIVHAALLAIAIAEIVHCALIVTGYRLGWHA